MEEQIYSHAMEQGGEAIGKMGEMLASVEVVSGRLYSMDGCGGGRKYAEQVKGRKVPRYVFLLVLAAYLLAVAGCTVYANQRHQDALPLVELVRPQPREISYTARGTAVMESGRKRRMLHPFLRPVSRGGSDMEAVDKAVERPRLLGKLLGDGRALFGGQGIVLNHGGDLLDPAFDQ